MAIYLVTGGAGFIGSHLATRLSNDGHDVRVLDNLCTGKRENLAHLGDRIDFREADLRDRDAVADACRGVEVVFHEGALPSVPRSVADPGSTHDACVNGTFNVLLGARDAGVRRVVYAASSSAYGESPTLPKQEDMPTDPMSPYGLCKLIGEQYCHIFHVSWGLETISLRYFNVFGPRQDPKSQYAGAIPAFVTAILNDRSPTIYGDGEQTRDLTYIDNVVQANMLAADCPGAVGQVVNVACGERITMNHIIARINELLGKDVNPNHVDPRPGDIKHSLADITRARELLGYKPTITFDQGLQLAIDYYKSLV